MFSELQIGSIVHDRIEILIQTVFAKKVRFLLNLLVVINILFKVKKILTIIFENFLHLFIHRHMVCRLKISYQSALPILHFLCKLFRHGA